MSNPVVWFEIYVQDMDRAKTFYESMLSVSLEKLENPGLDMEMEMWSFPVDMEAAGAAGALIKIKDMPTGVNSVLVYFACEDCAVEAEKAAAAGGKIEKPKTSIGQYGHIALISDTEGNMVGLHSRS
jgi:predicted enzyme related to lactoylglutathione lyase